LARQLIGGADPTLVRTLSECAINILRGNLALTATQKKRLKRYAGSLRTLSKKKGSVKNKKVLLMKGGFLGALLGTVVPLISSMLFQ
jgi:hypothetical protein